MIEPVNNQPNKMNAALSQKKLMVSGFIHLESIGNIPVEARRGMSILTQDGSEVGAVAAVVMDCNCEAVTHILLGQIPPTAVYRLVPSSLVKQVDGEAIRLHTTADKIEKLPLYHPDA